MEWVALVFLVMGVVDGPPAEPSSVTTMSFKSLELCAASTAKLGANTWEQIDGDVKTFARTV